MEFHFNFEVLIGDTLILGAHNRTIFVVYSVTTLCAYNVTIKEAYNVTILVTYSDRILGAPIGASDARRLRLLMPQYSL